MHELVLEPSARITPAAGPLLLVVMDGVGIGRGDAYDAVAQARTPNLDWLRAHAPWRRLKAHGTAVGLPSDEDMGNSEVGHNALGAGRIIDQGAMLVNRAIADGSIFRGEAWQAIAARCAPGGGGRGDAGTDTSTGAGALHLIGLLSDGNVHSHQDHLHALIDGAHAQGFRRVFVHALLDGRDVPETSAPIYIERLEEHLARYDGEDGCRYRIASGGGRMVTTMDRYEADWRIVERGWNAHVHGIGRRFSSAMEAVETYRLEKPGVIDQFLDPFVIAEGDEPVGRMAGGDAVVFFNFRGDRALEISRAFDEGDSFDAFDRGARPDVIYAGMTLYDGDLHIPAHYLVAPPVIDRTMSEYLARQGLGQFALSETQKYGHVTYFWNGNRGGMFDERTETYVEIASDRVPFEQRPWMKAAEITDRTLEALASGKHRFCRINFANGDMVGHTGELEPTVMAVEAVDLCLGRLRKAIDAAGGTLVVLADHGNADDMVERDAEGRPKLHKDGRPRARTAHSLNPVPCIVYRPGDAATAAGAAASGTPLALRDDLPEAGLANVAATVLELLGFAPPPDYEPSLLQAAAAVAAGSAAGGSAGKDGGPA